MCSLLSSLMYPLISFSQSKCVSDFRNPNSKTNSLPKWSAVYTEKVEYMHIAKDGCNQTTGWTEDPTYRFYRSLPIPWRGLPNVPADATKLNHVWALHLVCIIVLGLMMHNNLPITIL